MVSIVPTIRRLGETLTEEKMFFNKRWCAYPKRDFDELFDNISKGIDVKYNTEITEVDFQNIALVDKQNNSEMFQTLWDSEKK